MEQKDLDLQKEFEKELKDLLVKFCNKGLLLNLKCESIEKVVRKESPNIRIMTQLKDF